MSTGIEPVDVSEGNFDMQVIGTFLSFASRGDRVGLNQMLREGISPNVQDYDKRTALHLAASEGHASIVELLLVYKADANLQDRWNRTPLTDARLYGHRDICRILEVNGGKESISSNSMTVRHEEESNEIKFEFLDTNLQYSSIVEQGLIGESKKVKWRGTWVVKTEIRRALSAKDNTLLRELRHPNILQFLGSIVHGKDMILITEYLSKGNLADIFSKKVRLDVSTVLRFALDIARGMNYLHQHKPFPIVHNHLDPRNLLQDEGGHLKIGEYWVQMLYEQDYCQINGKSGMLSNSSIDTTNDIRSFGLIFYQMLAGRQLTSMNLTSVRMKSINSEPKFNVKRYSGRIQQLIQNCVSKDTSKQPSFASIIEILEEVLMSLGRPSCHGC